MLVRVEQPAHDFRLDRTSASGRLLDGRLPLRSCVRRPCCRRLCRSNLHDDHRHVVVRLGVADERAHFADRRARGCPPRRVMLAGSRPARQGVVARTSSPSASIASVMPSVYSTIHVAGVNRPRVLLEHLARIARPRRAAAGRAPCRTARRRRSARRTRRSAACGRRARRSSSGRRDR